MYIHCTWIHHVHIQSVLSDLSVDLSLQLQDVCMYVSHPLPSPFLQTLGNRLTSLMTRTFSGDTSHAASTSIVRGARNSHSPTVQRMPTSWASVCSPV